MNQPPSFLALCARGLLLLIVFGLVSSLSIAEFHYARGWPPAAVEDSLDHLSIAQKMYPFLPRFREGKGRRLQMFVAKGE